ncbi:LysR family transcriptional regulator [Chlorogloeopsis sp. ULAP01]|uniref:LysR family transcriptional regulator n=1 Tax=Chlorogloeopsis sp. ULAP01 TaxID=3056483 RepID=UPI0025AAE26B|nr:LysR family transcriptional regulator [Chlorogloeopsis sp. ULAP01]MDM9379870.1 LysR family transcriptional regulator [Chlorogloeopsis sp. ULAP01]
MESIQHFSLAGIDLNLLVVFDALMTEQHLTRAAEKIGLSQPATSNALARLRKLFKDDLFIKTSKGITPTPRAIALAVPIREALTQIQSVVSSQPEFDPKTSDRVFRIGMDDYTEIVFLSKLLQELSHIAPNVRVQVRSSTWQKAPKLLDADEIDLALGYFPEFSSWHQKQTLYLETFICVASAERFKKRKRLTIEEYASASHLLVSPKEDMVGMVDELLAQQGLSRIVAVSVPNFLIVPFVLVSTELVATIPSQIVATLTQTWNLYAFPLPFEMPGFSVDMLWHSKSDRDPGHTWLRELITRLCPE